MSFTLKTCQIDHFLDDQWNTIATFETYQEAIDALQSPLFYVEEFMLVGIGNYSGIYHKGEWVKLDDEQLARHFQWSYSSFSLDWKTSYHWLRAWKQCKDPIFMFHAICYVVDVKYQHNAMVECIRKVNHRVQFTNDIMDRLILSISSSTYFADHMRSLITIDENNTAEDEDQYPVPYNDFANILRKEIPIREIVRGLLRVL